MNIKTYLDGKYAVSHHMMDKAGMDANIHKPTVYMQTPFNLAIAYYIPIRTLHYLSKISTPAASK